MLSISDIIKSQNNKKEVISMAKRYTDKDINDGKRISAIFSEISEESKTMAIVYLSALRDKEISDSRKNKDLQEV